MKKIILLSTIILSILLSGCTPKLESGKVISMNVEPESTNLVLVPMMINKIVITQKYLAFDDEDFVLIIQGKDGNDKIITEKWYVTQKEYNKISVGDFKKFLSIYAQREDMHIKTKRVNNSEQFNFKDLH